MVARAAAAWAAVELAVVARAVAETAVEAAVAAAPAEVEKVASKVAVVRVEVEMASKEGCWRASRRAENYVNSCSTRRSSR